MGVAHQVDARPVRPILLFVEILVEVGSGLLQAVNPVSQRQVTEPGVGEGLGEVVRRQDVFVHLGQQVLTTRPDQGVAALMDGVGHHPAPLHGSAGVIYPALVEVGGSRHRGHAGQVRRSRPGGKGVLRRAQVRLAGGGDAPIAPGLAGGPLHGVVAILSFLEQRIVVVALGIEAGAAVLANHDVAALGEEPDGVFLVVRVSVLAIRPASDQRRKPAGRVGAVDVGRQPHSVAHGYHDISFADDSVLLCACHIRPSVPLPAGAGLV